MYELYKILEEGGEGTMLSIMEKEKKPENVCISENYIYLVVMRDIQDEKG